jgi:hypothetical protein
VPDDARAAQWKRIAEHLEEARASLTNPDDRRLEFYDDFLGNNELGLAFDALVDVADVQGAPSPVWEALAAAADLMLRAESDVVHGPGVRRVVERLTAGRGWLELRALLNEWDPIGVYDAAFDFPADEYDCMCAPLMLRLRRGETVDEIAHYLTSELHEHFGLDPTPSRPREFAERLSAWFASRDS